MRLLSRNSDGAFSLVEFAQDNTPAYAILSHTWGVEEVDFRDITTGSGKSKTGHKKIRFCAEQAACDGLQFFWVDTCCIDKSSSTELAEAINSMFRWYRDAAKCYVYLSDVSESAFNTTLLSSELTWESSFRSARWFTRGWTLQELIAPVSLDFFEREGKRLGDKTSLELQIHEVTGIPIQCLRGASLSSFSVLERMSWTKRRETTREEDNAYCLLGIFDIYMPLIYGEGRKNAFRRLEAELKKSSKRRNMRMEGSRISGNIGTTALDQSRTQEDPKSTEVKRSKGSEDTKSWADSAITRVSPENWEEMKRICSRLYLDDDRNLGEVMDLMRSIYGFNAGKAQYERKFREWGFRKNLKKSDWTSISRALERRKRSGKSTAVHLNGNLISEKKLRKEMSRSTFTLLQTESDSELPEDVTVTTPPPSQLSPAFTATQFHNIPWFEFQDALALIVKSSSTNGTTKPPIVFSELNLINSIEIRNVTQSILATSILNESGTITAPTLQSTHSYVRVLVPERYPRELLSAVEKIFSLSPDEVFQGCLSILILLCSNNVINDQQTYRLASLAYTGGARSLLVSIFSIPSPTVAEFANRLFRGALEEENLEIVRLLIHGPPHLNPSSTLLERRNTPLEFAVARGNIELIKILLEAGASPNDYMQPKQEWKSLSREAIIQRELNGSESITEDAKKFLARTTAKRPHADANPDLFDGQEGYGMDHVSTARSAAPVDKSVLEELEGSSIGRFEAKPARTALQTASSAGRLDIVRLLLEAGADVNASPAMHSGMTALQAASSVGRSDIVLLLLQVGADVNASPAVHSGMTALQAASTIGRSDIVLLLLEVGADVNASPAMHSGMTALQAASSVGRLDIVRFLLEAGADVNASPAVHSGMTALQAASSVGRLDIVRLLLEAGADVNASPAVHSGMTALQAAARAGNLDIVSVLLRAGANLRSLAEMHSKKTALRIAVENGNFGIVETILNTETQGYSPLEPQDWGILLRVAASNGYVGIIHSLLVNLMSSEANIVLPYLETAIEAAAERGRLDTVHLLCSLYRGIGGVGARFKTARTLAIRNGHYTVARLLAADNMDEH